MGNCLHFQLVRILLTVKWSRQPKIAQMAMPSPRGGLLSILMSWESYGVTANVFSVENPLTGA